MYTQHGLTKNPVGVSLLYGFFKAAEDRGCESVGFVPAGDAAEDVLSDSGKRFGDRVFHELGVEIRDPSHVSVSEVLTAFGRKGVEDAKIRFRYKSRP
jgi:hypothetical protein